MKLFTVKSLFNSSDAKEYDFKRVSYKLPKFLD